MPISDYSQNTTGTTLDGVLQAVVDWIESDDNGPYVRNTDGTTTLDGILDALTDLVAGDDNSPYVRNTSGTTLDGILDALTDLVIEENNGPYVRNTNGQTTLDGILDVLTEIVTGDTGETVPRNTSGLTTLDGILDALIDYRAESYLLSLFGGGDAGDLWLAGSIEGDVGDLVAAWTGERDTALAQSVDGRKPKIATSNGKRLLSFDIDDLEGSDVLGDCLLGEFAISTAELTIIVAAHNEDATGATGSAGNRRTVCLKALGPERDLNIHHNINPYIEPTPDLNGAAGMRHPENAAVQFPVAGNNALAAPGVVSYQRDGTEVQDAWIDGAVQDRVTTLTTTFTTSHLGVGYGLVNSLDFNTTGAGHWIGKIAGVLVIDRVLTEGERDTAETMMARLLP